MPELPEVEVIVRGLRRCAVGRRISRAEFLWSGLVIGDAQRTANLLQGLTICQVRRYGKYILIDVEGRRQRYYLTIHLRMTGNFIVNGRSGPYTRAILDL